MKQLACAFLLLGACTTHRPALHIYDAKKDPHIPPSTLGLPLRTGQLVLTESPDHTSLVFALVPEKFFRFTHAGILSIENGEPYVYEASGEVATFPLSSRVLDNVTGRVHRVPFLDHVSQNLYTEVFDAPAGADPERLAAYARQKYSDRAPFDAYFNYEEHEKIFCTELIALGIEHAGGAPIRLVPTNKNPSLRTGMRWLGVPMETALPAGVFAGDDRYRASLGQFPTRAAAYAFFEAKKVVHERFTGDQRLGFLFKLRGTGMVEVRPHVGKFLGDAANLFAEDDGPPDPDKIAESVRKLSALEFGTARD